MVPSILLHLKDSFISPVQRRLFCEKENSTVTFLFIEGFENLLNVFFFVKDGVSPFMIIWCVSNLNIILIFSAQ